MKFEGITSPYGEEVRAKRKSVNAVNKRRGKQLELDVAKYLDARRVPFSGAGAIKGDVHAKSVFGNYVIECKMSANWDKATNGPLIILSHAYMTKLFEEVDVMGARFGILVFHYHGGRTKYVIMRRVDWELITKGSIPYTELYSYEDRNYKLNRMPYKRVEEAMSSHIFVAMKWMDEEFVLMELPTFRAVMEDTELTDE